VDHPYAVTVLDHLRRARIVAPGEDVDPVPQTRQLPANLIDVDVLAPGIDATQEGQRAGVLAQ
jgi:hypothetical protein